MKLRTIREAAEELGISEGRLRRRAKVGELPVMPLGNRLLIDVDAAREVLTAAGGLTIEQVSARTGLTVGAIRQAISDGWLPATKPGREWVLQADEVDAAILARMQGSRTE